jgi:hypothetical protein
MAKSIWVDVRALEVPFREIGESARDFCDRHRWGDRRLMLRSALPEDSLAIPFERDTSSRGGRWRPGFSSVGTRCQTC